jgi:hypothetical protein
VPTFLKRLGSANFQIIRGFNFSLPSALQQSSIVNHFTFHYQGFYVPSVK